MSESEPNLQDELSSLLNKYNMDSKVNAPDYILSQYLLQCLQAFKHAYFETSRWHDRDKVQVAYSLEENPPLLDTLEEDSNE